MLFLMVKLSMPLFLKAAFPIFFISFGNEMALRVSILENA